MEIKNLSFRYKNSKKILTDINCKIQPGNFVAVLGNNGAGKSTLIKCLNNILHADTGEVLLDGENLLKMKQNEIAKRVSYVSQSIPKINMNVYDTVMLGRKPYMSWSFTQNDHKIAQETMKNMNLLDLSDRYVNHLSGGQRQKVMLARALTQQPKLLLLDEPTSGLDIQNQHQVLEIVQKICQEQQLISIVAIHDLNLALRFCTRFLLIKEGQVYKYGDSSILDHQTLREVYHIDVEVAEVNGHQVVLVN